LADFLLVKFLSPCAIETIRPLKILRAVVALTRAVVALRATTALRIFSVKIKILSHKVYECYHYSHFSAMHDVYSMTIKVAYIFVDMLFGL
jgi:hypothetical protein